MYNICNGTLELDEDKHSSLLPSDTFHVFGCCLINKVMEQHHRYQKSPNRLLKVCYVPTCSSPNRLLKVCYVPTCSSFIASFSFFAVAINSTNEGNKAGSMRLQAVYIT